MTTDLALSSNDLSSTDTATSDRWVPSIGAAISGSAAIAACIFARLPDRFLRLTGVRGWVPGLVVVIALVNGARAVARAPFTPALLRGGPLRWAARVASTVAVGAVFTVPLYLLLRSTSRWWLWAWAFFALVTVAGQVLMPFLLRVQCGALHPAPPALAERVQAIATTAGLPGVRGGVFVAEGSRRRAPAGHHAAYRNAYVVGLGPTRRVVLEAALAEWPEDLVDQVVAHELGHWRLRHTARRLPLTLALQLGTFVLAAAALSSHHLLLWAGAPSLADPRSYPVLLLLTAVVVLPAQVLLAAHDRRQERQADRFALTLLGDRRAFVEMLDRLGREGDAVRTVPWWRHLTATHPPIDQRISDCLAFEKAPAVPKGMHS